MSAHNYHPHCGCSDCCRAEEAPDPVAGLMRDPDWYEPVIADVSCDFQTETYNELWVSLFELSDEPIGSDALADLLRKRDLIRAAVRKRAERDAEAQEARWAA